MSGERRFSEREIREVFERAAAEQERSATRHADDGLTLAEMQEVAASAGIAPEFVAAAARSVALGEPEGGRQSIGPIPRGVFRTALLPGPPTDALWEHVLTDARRTFSARGKVTTGGRVQEWRNGNLRVTLEPAAEGSRLHLQTRRSGVRDQASLVAVALVVGVVLALLSLTPAVGPEAMWGWIGALLGGTVGGLGLWTGQRRWADTRERQMAEIAERAGAVAVEESEAAVPTSARPARIDPAILDLDGPDPLSDDEGQPAAGRRRTR